jgi:Tfp pilus assembly protein FimT
MLTALYEGARRRLAGERGFTLIEMLVSIALGIVVLAALAMLLDSSGRASTRLADKAETVQRLRIGVDRIARVLRTQVCADSDTPPIVSGTADSITFYSDTNTTSDFSPKTVQITFDSAAGTVVQKTWNSTAANVTSTTPDRTRSLLDKASRIGNTPFLSYYSWVDLANAVAVPLSPSLDSDSLPDNSIAKIVRVDVALQASPTGGNPDVARKATMTTSIYTRNADFSGQASAGRTWGPRCG